MRLGNRFDIVERVGVGGTASVYRGFDLEEDRPVAVKIIHPDLADDPEHCQWFSEEARLMASLDHIGLPRFVAQSTGAEDLDWFAMEFIEGQPLTVRRDVPISTDDILIWGLEVADTLSYLHTRGIVHRDVKPDNIMVKPDGHAVLIDLGIAHDPQLERTQVGALLGTPAFMPPEQAIDPASVEPRSDLYSLGVTLFAALTRRSGFELAYAHTRENALHAVSAPLNAILARATEPRQEDRFPTAQHLLQAFSEALED